MRGETVILVRRTQSGRDVHGNVTWSSTEISIPGTVVWPGAGSAAAQSTEDDQGQTQILERMSALFPFGTSVLPTDQALIRGALYEVRGQPASWESGFTHTRAGVETQFSRVRG